MNGTKVFIQQYLRKEDSNLNYFDLITRYQTTNDSRYLAQLYNKLSTTITTISNLFPTIDEELKFGIALEKINESINCYKQEKGNFNTLFSSVYRNSLLVILENSLAQKNIANMYSTTIPQQDEEDTIFFELTYEDNSYNDLVYKESILKDKRLTSKEKKLCMFLIDNYGTTLNEQAKYMGVSKPTIIKTKKKLQKYFTNF